MKRDYRREIFPTNLYGNELPVFYFDEIDSTNEEAKRFLTGEEGEQALFVANGQTQGKGRRGRTFYSPDGEGIYMSLLFSTTKELSDVIFITTAASVIVAKALEEIVSEPVSVKWVNDLYLNGRKICGILTEAVLPTPQFPKTGIIVGIGINVSTEYFPDELKETAGSLGVKENMQAIKTQLIETVTNGLVSFLTDAKKELYLEEYRKRSMVIGQQITCFDGAGSYEATALDIEQNGGLVVETQEGERKVLHTGEITIRLCDA